jgi:hypothetical protein
VLKSTLRLVLRSIDKSAFLECARQLKTRMSPGILDSRVAASGVHNSTFDLGNLERRVLSSVAALMLRDYGGIELVTST